MSCVCETHEPHEREAHSSEVSQRAKAGTGQSCAQKCSLSREASSPQHSDIFFLVLASKKCFPSLGNKI